MDKFNELLSKYGKTIEDVDFDYEGLTDEELEQKFKSVFGDAQSDDEPSDDKETPKSDEKEAEGESDETFDNDPEAKENEACGGGCSGSGSKKRKKNNSEEPAEDMVRTYTISHEDIRYALYQLLSEFESADNEWYCRCRSRPSECSLPARSSTHKPFPRERWRRCERMCRIAGNSDIRRSALFLRSEFP